MKKFLRFQKKFAVLRNLLQRSRSSSSIFISRVKRDQSRANSITRLKNSPARHSSCDFFREFRQQQQLKKNRARKKKLQSALREDGGEKSVRRSIAVGHKNWANTFQKSALDAETINKSNERVAKRGEGRKVCRAPRSTEAKLLTVERRLLTSLSPFNFQWWLKRNTRRRRRKSKIDNYRFKCSCTKRLTRDGSSTVDKLADYKLGLLTSMRRNVCN